MGRGGGIRSVISYKKKKGQEYIECEMPRSPRQGGKQGSRKGDRGVVMVGDDR